MSLDFDENELDQFLKQKLNDFRKAPNEEHWKRFEQNFEPKQISLKKFNHYRVALWSAVAIAASILIILLTNPKIATIPETSPLTTKLEKQEKRDSLKSLKTNQSTHSGHEEQSHKKSEVSSYIRPSNQGSASVQNTCGHSANPVQPTPDIPMQKLHEIDEYKLIASLGPSELQVTISTNIQKSFQKTAGESLNPDKLSDNHIRTKKKQKSNLPLFARKHSTRTFLYSRHPSRNYMAARHRNRTFATNSKLAQFLSDLEYKINVTPQYCGQTLNNKGGIAINDFDPQFYRSIENGKLTFSGGLEVVYPINNQWSIYSGLKISTYKREANNNVSHLKDSNGQLSVPTSAGDIIIHDLTKAQLNSQAGFKSLITLRAVEIPIIIRRQISKSFYIDGGIKYGYTYSVKTQTKLTGDNKQFSYDQISDIHDQNLSLVVGTGVTFITGSGLKFDAGPEICWNLTNLNPSSNLINKPLIFGLRTTLSLERYRRN